MSEKKSKYQQKMRRKHSGGRVDPKWMWWFERGARQSAVVSAPQHISQPQSTEAS